MSTPIEIVRAELDWWDKCHKMERPHGLFEFYPALAAVLRDAERFKALEAVFARHNNEGTISALPWKGGRVFYYNHEPDIDGSTLADLADRLMKEKTT